MLSPWGEIMRIANVRLLLLACLALFAVACTPLIAGYSLEAYQNATSLKAETVALINQAQEPFPQHAQEVRALRVRLAAAREFTAGMPRNRLSTAQWDIMNNPTGGLAGGFLARWERDGTLGAGVIREQSAVIARSFDHIICLEANKGSDTECTN
jgi:hypothetical protein